MSSNRVVAVGLIVWALAIGFISCTAKRASQAEIVAFIDALEGKLEYVNRRVEQCRWEYYTTGQSDSLAVFHDAYVRLLTEPGLAGRVKQYLSIAHDDKSRRKLDLLYRRCLREIVNNDSSVKEMAGKLSRLAELSRPAYEGQTYTRHELFTMIKSEPNRYRRQAIYSAAVSVVDEIVPGLEVLAGLRNRAAVGFGYGSYYELMLRTDGIIMSDFQDLLEDLDNRTAAAYAKTLDSLKRSLKSLDVQIWDIEFAFRETDVAADQYFPVDNQVKLAAATLDTLGFALAGSPIYLGAMASGVGDTPMIMPVHIPDDIRVPLRAESGTLSMRHLFFQIGRALYTANIDRQDFLFAQPASSCFCEGMTRVIGGLAETSAWYRKYAGMPDPLVMELAARDDFFRLFNLRLALVNLHFERLLYTDPSANLDHVYAGLFEKYMMFPLEAGLRPWAADAGFITEPVSIQNGVLGQCIQAQVWHYLTEKHGTVLDDRQLRKYLYQNLYRSGSREDWPVIIERATGEELQARYFLELSTP